METAVGKYIRTKFNEIYLIVEQIGDDTYFLRSPEIDGAFTEMQAYIMHVEEITIKVADFPQELAMVDDLIFTDDDIIQPFVICHLHTDKDDPDDTDLMFDDWFGEDTMVSDINRILFPNAKRGYTLLWVAS